MRALSGFPMPVPSPLIVSEDALEVIDCRALPERVEYMRLTNVTTFAQAIRDWLIFGPTLIPSAAAHAVALEARNHRRATSLQGFQYTLQESLYAIRAARPSSRPLMYAVERIGDVVRRLIVTKAEVEECCTVLKDFADDLTEELKNQERYTAAILLEQLPANGRLMITGGCGKLSSAGNGSIVEALAAAQSAGKSLRITVPAGYPLMMGHRITGFELEKRGLAYELIADSLVATRFLTEKYDAVIALVNRLMDNGDASCTSGATNAALAAKFAGVPFYAVVPSPAADPSTPNLKACPIEEMTFDDPFKHMAAAMNSLVPAELITGYITSQELVLTKNMPPDEHLARKLAAS